MRRRHWDYAARVWAYCEEMFASTDDDRLIAALATALAARPETLTKDEKSVCGAFRDIDQPHWTPERAWRLLL